MKHTITDRLQHELIPIITTGEQQLVDARTLHERLKSKQKFADWVKNRIDDYGFKAKEDYFINLGNRYGDTKGKKRLEYHLTMNMAKELAMVERTELGRRIRRYFIEAELQLQQLGYYMLDMPEHAGLFAGLDIIFHNNKKHFLYTMVLRYLAFSRSSGAVYSRTRQYPDAFITKFGRRFISEEYAVYLSQQKQRIEGSSQLLIPFSQYQQQGGVYA